MKRSLKTAVERYDIEESSISPISSLDAEIIVELGQIFDKLKQPDLKSMVDEWKTLPDVKIRDLLLDWNTNHPKETPNTTKKKEEEDKDPFTRKILDFEGQLWDVSSIRKVEKAYLFNENIRIAQPFIVFNRGSEGIFGETRFPFNTEQLRDQAYSNLKILLEKTDQIEFI